MRMSITCYDNWLLPCPIAHSTEPARRVVVRNIRRFDEFQALLQIHSSAKRFVSSSREDRAS
jgi:hypothetical protein